MTFTTTRRRLLVALGFSPAAVAVPAASAAPPAREPLRILFTRVNGESYYAARDALPTLAPGDVVTLLREPDNIHDKRAIEVFAAGGHKLGYVARIDNSALARMMDAGETFVARVARIEAGPDIRLTVDWVR